MIEQPPLFILRADADSRIGAGHVMRCLALAQTWHDRGGEAVFAGNITNEALRHRLESEGFQVAPFPETHPDTRDLAFFIPWLRERHMRAGWVAIDGYHFDPAYHQAVRATGWPVFIIDDYGHLPAYHGEIVVNPNAYAGDVAYQTIDQTLLLRGTRFVPLRREFQQELSSWNDARGTRRTHHQKPCILVTMGGADPDNVTGKVIDVLAAMGDSPSMEIKIIAGPLSPHRQVLESQLRRTTLNAELLAPVNDMAPLMRWADMAISAAGSTCWELAAMGVPMVVTVLAENQERLAASLVDQGAAVNLGWHHGWQTEQAASVCCDLLADPQKRKMMGQRGQQLVDGRGGGRLIQAMLGYTFSLKTATEDDSESIFQLSNDPLVRAVSFSPASINWQVHCQWFANRLADPCHIFYIASTQKGIPVAQARFSLSGNGEAVISVSLARDFRGVGLGAHLIRRACKQVMAEKSIHRIRALIREDNIASRQAFAQAGFKLYDIIEVSGQQSVTMDYSVSLSAIPPLSRTDSSNLGIV